MEAEAKKHFYEVTTDIGRAMAALRRYRGLSPEQAAAQMGITDKKLAAIERGVLTQNMNNICNLVESLGGRLAIVPEEQPSDPHCQFIEFEIEPLIIEGRPFTPEDFLHIDELNEEMLKQNPPKPYQWKKGMLSPREWEELYLQRPISIPDPTDEKTEQ